MGTDAKADIFYGVPVTFNIELPKEIIEKLGGMDSWESGSFEQEGFRFEVFHTGEEVVGFGVQLVHHDWDYGIKSFPLKNLTGFMEFSKDKIDKIFQSWGIDHAIDIYVNCDYS